MWAAPRPSRRGRGPSWVDAPHLQGGRDLADRSDERPAPQAHPLLLVQRPDALECVAELVVQPGADLVAVPEQAPEVLHPLEVRDGYAARVREHVREYDDPAVGEDPVG